MTPSTTYPLRAALMLALVAGIGLAACGKKDAADKGAAPETKAATTPAADAPKNREVTITSVKPDGVTLKPGQTVTFVVAAEYRLPPGGGNIGLVVQDAKNAPIANKLVPVAAESGSIEEQIDFQVPATDRIVLNVPLYAQGDKKSSAVATKEFVVRAR